MGYELSLSARREITKKQAWAYASASKKGKGEILARLLGEVGTKGGHPPIGASNDQEFG